MPPRKKAFSDNKISRHCSQQTEEEAIAIVEERFKSFDPKEIYSTVHPFENARLCQDKPLSLIQRAITCCINYSGGYATDNEILLFLIKFWPDIANHGERIYKQLPDRRLLHVAFSNRKGGARIFVQHPTEAGLWGVNKFRSRENDSDRNTEYTGSDEDSQSLGSDEPTTFEQRVDHIIKNSKNGKTVEELEMDMEPYSKEEGLFSHLELGMRLRALLISRKNENIYACDEETDRWSLAPVVDTSNFRANLPPELQNRKISTISIDDLYDIVMKPYVENVAQTT